MNSTPEFDALRYRDGTSQKQRHPLALDTDYFLLDEQSLEGLLDFARSYGKQLKYFNQIDEHEGYWDQFIPEDNKEILAFINDPSVFDDQPEKKARYAQPHFVLFLTFLQLLQHARTEMNSISHRHLEYYYREALLLTRKKAEPDEVHLIVDLASGVQSAMIPKGTALLAGKDGEGKDLLYKTTSDLVANRAKVAKKMSLFVDKKVTGLPEIKDQFLLEPSKLHFELLRMAMAKKGIVPEANLEYLIDTIPPVLNEGLLTEITNFLNFILKQLGLRFSEFRELMALYFNRKVFEIGGEHLTWTKELAGVEWQRINQLLPGITIKNPRDFKKNVDAYLGYSIVDSTKFDGIPDVKNLYELYEKYELLLAGKNEDREILAERFLDDSLAHFKNKNLKFFKKNNFLKLMSLRMGTINEWKAIIRILENGARRKGIDHGNKIHYQDYLLDPIVTYLENIVLLHASNFKEIESFKILNVETCYYAMMELENYLEMDSEEFLFLATIPARGAEWQWDRAYEILTNVHRKKNPDDPLVIPQKVEWQNLYQATDATTLVETHGLGDDGSHPRWKTFGRKKGAETALGQTGQLGLAIASPILALDEGTRKIDLTFSLDEKSYEIVRDLLNKVKAPESTTPFPFLFFISTEKEMLPIPFNNEFNLEDNGFQVIFNLALLDDFPPIVTLQEAGSTNTHPCIQIVLADLKVADTEIDQTYKMVDVFLNVKMKKIRIDVEVLGIQKVQLQNDNGLLDAKKPFFPFTNLPTKGKKWYLTHPEIIRKKIDRITLKYDWVNLPKGKLEAYYKTYVDIGKTIKPPLEIKITDNTVFKVKAAFKDGRRLLVQNDDTHSLFLPKKPIDVSKPFIDDKYDRLPAAVIEDDVLNSNRYLQLELMTPDFQHSTYSTILTRLGQLMLPEPAEGQTNKYRSWIVNPPLVPEMENLRLSYYSHTEIEIKSAKENTIDRIFHLHPFGYNDIEISVGEETVPFFPYYHNEGQLFLGIENLEAPQVLNLLFQMAEGSANPDLKKSTVHWEYLSGATWKSLSKSGRILSDSTQGLLTSGIIQFDIPADATNEHTHMPTSYHWLRASVAEGSGSLSDTIAIESQALRAIFTDQDNAADHYANPLKEGTIKDAETPMPSVKQFLQPFTSFFGKPQEANQQFYTRVAERLRHKERAISLWDYERLVLEAFPDIYKAKCIPADVLGNPQNPGQVQMVLIPDIRGRQPFDPFSPKVAADRLLDVQHFLEGLASPWADIRVKNPVYFPLKVRLGVHFNDTNTSFYQKQLELELKKYLSPWAYDHSADIALGWMIYPSHIVDFLDSQPYVDFVTELSFTVLDRRPNGKLEPIMNSTDEAIILQRPDAILVSAASHEIVILDEEDYVSEDFEGIGYMRTEIDFKIEKS